MVGNDNGKGEAPQGPYVAFDGESGRLTAKYDGRTGKKLPSPYQETDVLPAVHDITAQPTMHLPALGHVQSAQSLEKALDPEATQSDPAISDRPTKGLPAVKASGEIVFPLHKIPYNQKGQPLG